MPTQKAKANDKFPENVSGLGVGSHLKECLRRYTLCVFESSLGFLSRDLARGTVADPREPHVVTENACRPIM